MADYKAIAPEAGGYNIWSPLYAQSVARGTGNPGADVLNQLVLAIRSQREAGSYADALRQANENQLAGTKVVTQGEVDKSYIGQLAPMAQAGILHGVNVPGSSVQVDPTIAQQAGAVYLDNEAAQGIQRRADAAASIAEALDIRPTQQATAELMSNPIQEVPTPVEPYISFDKNTDRMKAEASMLGARASMVSANRPPSGGGGGGGGSDNVKAYFDVPMTPGAAPTARFVGDPAAASAAAAAFAQRRDDDASNRNATTAATDRRNAPPRTINGRPNPEFLRWRRAQREAGEKK